MQSVQLKRTSLVSYSIVVDMFTRETPWEVEHIALAKRADVFLVAPASANFLGKYANGIADDMLTTTVLATKAPVVLAPAMNTDMWSNAIVQKNVEALKSLGVSMVGPGSGYLACGYLVQGRMSEPEEIVEEAAVPKSPSSPNTKKNASVVALVFAFAAAAIIVLRYLLNDTIQNEDDVKKYLGLHMLAAIPTEKRKSI